jgi:hypothetical protein
MAPQAFGFCCTEELLSPKRRVLQPGLDRPHTPARMNADAEMPRCCRLYGAGIVTDAASSHSPGFAVTLGFVAAPAGMPRQARYHVLGNTYADALCAMR